jgi:hypothetical protein
MWADWVRSGMTDRRRFDDEFRQAIRDSPTPPVRWERVADLHRRRTLSGLVGLVVVGIASTLLVSLGAFAGKSALDPSYRPPLLSNASGDVVLHRPKLGWALVDSATVPSGYLMRADLDLRSLKSAKLVAEWTVHPVSRNNPERHLVIERRRQVIVPRSNSEDREIEKWISRPQHTGLYRVHLKLMSVEGKVFDEDRSGVIYVVGADCCERYRTPMYISVLPRGWRLDEDFAPNPEERFVTLARGPAENSLDIDTSLIDVENKGGNPLEKARELEELVARNGTGYRLLSWRQYQLRGGLAVEWSYRLEGDAFTDIFFYRGPSGFAVLGRSAPAHFRETRDLTRIVAGSVSPRP